MYVGKCGGCLETAPGPERAIEGGRYSLDFAIKVAIDKNFTGGSAGSCVRAPGRVRDLE
jgi:hypothetical protein